MTSGKELASQGMGALHEATVVQRRKRTLVAALAPLLPQGGRILDVGCGDGQIDRLIMTARPDLAIEGIDILTWQTTHIPVRLFDGRTIPSPDKSFDAVLFVDMLHHTADPVALLGEAMRVAPLIVIKDHLRDGALAQARLRLMDWVGNLRHGVVLPYNYWSSAQWQAAFRQLGLAPEAYRTELGLYPPPLSWLFEKGLHFVTRLAARPVHPGPAAAAG